MMPKPYDNDADYERGSYSRRGIRRDFDYDRDYEQDHWPGGGQTYRGRSYAIAGGSRYTEDWQVPGPFTGRGPRGYQRSDERIKEDVSDRLTQHGQIDATDIEVRVENCEVTLIGTVDSREAKRMAEDVSDAVLGVRDVHNKLRVKHEQQRPQGQPGTQNWAEAQNERSVQSQQTAQQRAVGGTEGRS
jgi:hypothetical protein